jgi:hypothetical protein
MIRRLVLQFRRVIRGIFGGKGDRLGGKPEAAMIKGKTMRFCDFITTLKKHYASSSKERFALDAFAALCGEANPIWANDQFGYSSCLPQGLCGDDATYRKLLYSGNNKKYNGLSAPIKAHVLQHGNKLTFIAYSETAVSTLAFVALCTDFGVSSDSQKALVFEAVFEQFLEFARATDDNTPDAFVSDFVTDRLMNPPVEVAEIEKVDAPPVPLCAGDYIRLIRQNPSRPHTAAFYDKLTHHWVIKNSGVAVWDGRYMDFVNSEDTPLKIAVSRIEINKTPPGGEVTITVQFEARHIEGTHEIVLA